MKRTRKLILILIMGVASINIIIDLIHIFMGYTYTWYGLITAIINLIIVGVGLDIIRG